MSLIGIGILNCVRALCERLWGLLRVRVYEESFLYHSGPAEKFANVLLTGCSRDFDPIFDPIIIAKCSQVG